LGLIQWLGCNLGWLFQIVLNQHKQDYNQAIELDPEYTYAFNNRGLAYADLKQFEKAIQDYDQAIELNPKDFNAFNNRGTAYAKLKQFEKKSA
jgi:regulator of sirC expression with transglutaminase-like and TPR domain